MSLHTKSVDTHWVRLYLSGPIEVAKQVCREECLSAGLCVTIEPTTFIYTGGEESGYVVGLVNYPRFPATPEALNARARELAIKLLDRTCQHSVLVMNPQTSEWLTKRAIV
jgi:ferredoxin